MSVASDTVLILLFLLPGFLFLVGLYAHEHVSRDITAWRAPGQLAAVITVAFISHVIAFIFCFLVKKYCTESISWLNPFIYLENLWELINSESPVFEFDKLEKIGLFVAVYITVTSLIGAGLGRLVSWQIGKGRFRFLIKHEWVYDIIENIKDGFIIAYVLTRIQHDDNVLMYKGVLTDIFVGPDGQISYLRLKQCDRYYMMFKDSHPEPSEPKKWRPIEPSNNQLLIEGEDIANVVFALDPMLSTPRGEKIIEDKAELEKFKQEVKQEVQNKKKKRKK